MLHMAETERKRPRLKDLPGGQVTELIVIVITALAIALAVQWLLVKPYRIPSGSMPPCLKKPLSSVAMTASTTTLGTWSRRTSAPTHRTTS